MSNKLNWVGVIFIAIQLFSLTVSAIIGCAAEANFQACKAIEESALRSCGPVDYACQCGAQKLIQQCYNLCPEYSIDANERARIVVSICAAVPTSSALPLPSITPSTASSSIVPSTTGSIALPSSKQSVTTSSAISIQPLTQFLPFMIVFVAFFIL